MRRTISFDEEIGLYIAENNPAVVEVNGKSGVASGDGQYIIFVPHKICHVRKQAARKLRLWLLHKYLPSFYTFKVWAVVSLSYQASCIVNGTQYCFNPEYAHQRVMVYPAQPDPLFRMLQRPIGPFIKPSQTITIQP
jgi:hypothetical protein